MAVAIKPKVSHTASNEPTTSDLVEGEIAINTADKKLYIRDDSSQIVAIGGGANCTIGESAPSGPNAGDLWWDSTDTDANLKIYYTDADSTSQWVTTHVPAIHRTHIGESAPSNPATGDMWWDSTDTDGQLKIYYNDGDSSAWIVAMLDKPLGVSGTDGSVLYNNGGAMGADGDLTWNDATNTLSTANLTVAGVAYQPAVGANTGITSIYNSSLKIGYGETDATIDFSTDNAIEFKIDNTKQVVVKDGKFYPSTTSDVTLGQSSKTWSTTYTDDIEMNGESLQAFMWAIS